MKKLPEDKDIKTYLSHKSALIADTNAVSRSSIMKFLHSMGMPSDRITSVDNFHDAQEAIQKYNPDIIFAEYVIQKNSGIELVPLHFAEKPNRLEASFYIISNSNSMAIAAQIAELDVDGLITKPYTVNGLKVCFINGIAHKVKPTEYFQNLEKARKLMTEKKSEEALALLGETKLLTTEPSSACYVEGMVFKDIEKMLEAKNSFQEGIAFNPEHYKCLNSLFNIYLEEKNYDQAYELGSTLYKKFPISPTRIPEMTRLMIASNNFNDILELAAIFSKEESIDPLMITYIAAALAIAAKHFAILNNKEETLKVVKQGSTLAAGNVKILRNMANSLIRVKATEEAEKLLKLVSESDQSTENYQLMDFEINNALLPAADVIKRARDLLQKGVVDQTLYEIALTRFLESGFKQDVIEDLYRKAIKHFPHLKNTLPKTFSPS